MNTLNSHVLIEYTDIEVPGIISSEVESLVRSVERLILTGRTHEVVVLLEALKQIPHYRDFSVSEYFFREFDSTLTSPE